MMNVVMLIVVAPFISPQINSSFAKKCWTSTDLYESGKHTSLLCKSLNNLITKLSKNEELRLFCHKQVPALLPNISIEQSCPKVSNILAYYVHT